MRAMEAPLDGILVLDLTRMLPGAVLARQLIDLGARLVKVEDPAGGDPMRQVPPQRGGVGVGFAALLRGAESAVVDLRSAEGAEAVARMARRADVLVESFRPGTMERWGIGAERLTAANPGLVYCSLSGWGVGPAAAHRVGHDLNFTASTGMLDLIGAAGVPRLQLADVGAALLAASAILAALLRRARSGRGAVLDQPLVSGPMPFLAWAWAESAAGETGVLDTLLAGRFPCYRRYRCGDGRELALSVLEPKLWVAFLELIGRPDLLLAGVDPGDEGQRAAAAIGEALGARPRAEWLALAEEQGLPLSAVHDLAAARSDPFFAAAGLVEGTPMPDGSTLATPGPFLPSLGRTPERPAPRLGEHTEALLAELAGG
jgi:alpha-methylacyl-CoA racemase